MALSTGKREMKKREQEQRDRRKSFIARNMATRDASEPGEEELNEKAEELRSEGNFADESDSAGGDDDDEAQEEGHYDDELAVAESKTRAKNRQMKTH